MPRGKSPKLHCYWQSPYRVLKLLGDLLLLVQHRDSPRKHLVVHFDRLKPYASLPEVEDFTPGEGNGTGGLPAEKTDPQMSSSSDFNMPEMDRTLEIEWEPHQNVLPPPSAAEPVQTRPHRHRKKPDLFGQNIYDTGRQ